jgi:hypothetical protein
MVILTQELVLTVSKGVNYNHVWSQFVYRNRAIPVNRRSPVLLTKPDRIPGDRYYCFLEKKMQLFWNGKTYRFLD